MKGTGILRPVVSILLAAVLLFFPGIPIYAVELPEPTAAAEPPETATATEPEASIPETTAAVEETVPEATAAAETAETVPETTASTGPEERIPETTTATEPEETLPETMAVPEPKETPTEPQTVETVLSVENAVASPVMATLSEAEVRTIAEVQAMPSGTEHITTRGIVVFAMGTQAVLQDETGGIRLAFPDAPELSLGDVLLAKGNRSGGFSVTEYAVAGTAELPAIQTTLLDAEEEVRLHIKNAVLGRRELQQQGTVYSLSAQIPAAIAVGDRVDAFGVILDGHFYADTLLPASAPEDTIPGEGEWNFYFGQLHAHTLDSDGLGTPAQAYAAAKAAGLDFFAVTDHSHSFENDELGATGTEGASLSATWEAGQAAALAATDDTFAALYGYEMTWDRIHTIGHINTFFTPGWQSKNQEGFASLGSYCEALSTVPGSVSQFNHPDPQWGDFGRFQSYDPAQDAVIQLIEVGSESGTTAYEYYGLALDAGWHLAPTNSEATHNGQFAASSVRTVVLAKELTPESLQDAMLNHRVYATEDADLKILYTMNGQIMGSVMPEGEELTVDVSLSDPTDGAIGTVEVISHGGKSIKTLMVSEGKAALSFSVNPGSSYYYLRVTQPDGETAVTAPIWVDAFDQIGIEDFQVNLEAPEVGQEVILKLDLYNQETEDFLIDSVEFFQGSTLIPAGDLPACIPARGNCSITAACLCPPAGQTTISVTVRGSVAGLARSYQGSCSFLVKTGPVALSPISDVRKGLLGDPYRVKGYVTAGTSHSSTTFEDTLYLQDDSGGIAVVDFSDPGIQVGAPMDITGILRRVDGNVVLALTEYEVLTEDHYRYVPRTMTHELAMNYEEHGGELLQIEGQVVSLTKTADGKGISRFTIKDILGDLATVVIEDGIGSTAYDTNELASQVKKGRTVRALGLLHIDEFGQTVLRVRNCEEVVYVPPVQDPTNPKTGDFLVFWK